MLVPSVIVFNLPVNNNVIIFSASEITFLFLDDIIKPSYFSTTCTVKTKKKVPIFFFSVNILFHSDICHIMETKWVNCITFKGVVHFKKKKKLLLIIYSPPCHPRWSLSFFSGKEIKFFNEFLKQDFSPYNGLQ